jgi:hypothetical protein
MGTSVSPYTEVHYWERLHFEIPYAAMVRQCRLTL